jgi:hypothetical protein
MPAPTPVFRYLFLILPAVFLFTAGARLYGFLHQRDDIWWTPRGLQVPLTESHDRVAIYVGSRELDDLLAAGQLRLLRDSVAQVVSPADVGLRFNNWDRVRAERIASVLISGVTVGAAAALLLVGLTSMRPGGRLGGASPPGTH